MDNKIIQGDCVEEMKKLPDNSINLVLCDLPYEVTKNKWDKGVNLKEFFKESWRVLNGKGIIILTSQQPFTTKLISTEPNNFRYELIWEKSKASGFLNAKRMPLRSHESILVFYKKLGTYNPQMFKAEPYNKGIRKEQESEDSYGKYKQTMVKSDNGMRYPRSVLYFKTAESEGKTFHKTQKPLSLFEYLIKTYSNEGDIVLDGCVGSGTTGIACIRNNRKFIVIDKEKQYVKITKDRIKQTLVEQDE